MYTLITCTFINTTCTFHQKKKGQMTFLLAEQETPCCESKKGAYKRQYVQETRELARH